MARYRAMALLHLPLRSIKSDRLHEMVADSAAVLNAIAGWDRRDATSLKREYGDFSVEMGRDVKGMRAALPKEYFGKGISPEVENAVLAAARQYEKMGCETVETSLPSLDYALPAYYILSSAEASSNLARFDGVKYGYRASDYSDIDELYCRTRSEGFGPEVKRRIMLGSFALSSGYYDAYYKKAQQVRTLVVRDFNGIFETCDFYSFSGCADCCISYRRKNVGSA